MDRIHLLPSAGLVQTYPAKSVNRWFVEHFVCFHDDMREKEINKAVPHVIRLLALVACGIAVFTGMLLYLLYYPDKVIQP